MPTVEIADPTQYRMILQHLGNDRIMISFALKSETLFTMKGDIDHIHMVLLRAIDTVQDAYRKL